MGKLLSAFQDRYYRAFHLWPEFKHKAAADGYTTNDALARLIQRYLARGFDDGQPEQHSPVRPQSDRVAGN
jgi:hypothetical protein